jgi:DNA uptake protein ComE-like DNA-binding protein
MRVNRGLSALIVAGFVLLAAAPGHSQTVAKKAAKKGAKEATESAARDAAEDAAKGAAKKAMAPDAVDLNAASPEQLTKVGITGETATKLVAGRPYSGLDDAKLKEAIPADMLKKLEGKVTVKPPSK